MLGGHARQSTINYHLKAVFHRSSIGQPQIVANPVGNNDAMRHSPDAYEATRRPQATGPAAPAPMTRHDGSPIEVLVVDDEPALGDLVAMALRYEGWLVTAACDGASAIKKAADERPDIVVLDIMLPDMSGLDVLHELHRIRPELPVLLLTAKDTIEDRIAGLSAGGDDYVTKPFNVEEMVLRMRALVRRSGIGFAADSAQLVVGDLVLDEDSREVTRAGAEINLTATEFEVLRLMMNNPRRVLTKAQILRAVWDWDFEGRSNVVELYISYLRKKIDADRTPMIQTVRGIGYVLKPQ